MKLKNLFLYEEISPSDFKIQKKNRREDFTPQKNEGGERLSGVYIKDTEKLRSELLKKSGDVKERSFTVRISGRDVRATIFFIDGLTDKALINDFILKPLMLSSREIEISSFRSVCEILLPQAEIKKNDVIGELMFDINFGSVLLFIEGMREAVSIDVKGWEHRSVESPQTERVIRGPNDAFSEQIRETTALIRHLVRNKSLIIKECQIGTISQTPVSVMYIENIANTSLVDETLRRINGIDIDYLFSTAELEQFIEDKSLAAIPQFLSTERPDRAARALLRGKIVIAVDGSPFVTVLPTTVFELNESAEDNYLRFPYVNMIRAVRTLAFLLSMFLPGFYIATVCFHTELLPTDILMSIAATRERVPFPTIVEITVMEIALEIIREAGVRVPEASGTTLSIVGALILGQAAVSAGIVSPVLIIIVSITAIGSFATPNYYLGLAARILRFVYIFLGANAGFLGITAGAFINAVLWTDIMSMGVPMSSPVTPRGSDATGVIYNKPIWMQEKRASFLHAKRTRQQAHISRKWMK